MTVNELLADFFDFTIHMRFGGYDPLNLGPELAKEFLKERGYSEIEINIILTKNPD